MASYREVSPNDWNYEALNKSADMLRLSEEPLDWVTPMLNLWRPPQGYVTDNEEGNETTAVLMMLLEGMLNDEFTENKLMFMACCAKIWEDNLELGR
tara:strand:- start:16 stop:306 length:291 start_codon:yes stop_codon:yes gene_type:complete